MNSSMLLSLARQKMFIRNNMLVNPWMNKDSDSNGVVDSFILSRDTNVTSTFVLDSAEGAQKITLTGGTVLGGASVYQTVSGFAEGQKISLEVEAKASANVTARFQVDFLTNSTYISSIVFDYTLTTWGKAYIDVASAPAGTTRVTFNCKARAKSIGATGDVKYRFGVLHKK